MYFRGNYHESIPEVSEFYRSFTGYTDELIWSAAWLYKATGNETYLADAEQMYTRAGGSYLTEQEYSWDQKMIGAQVEYCDCSAVGAEAVEEAAASPGKDFIVNID